jgi:hypothetical protein
LSIVFSLQEATWHTQKASITANKMASESLSWTYQVDDRIKEIANRLDGKDNFNNNEAPGLKALLDNYVAADEVEPEDFIRDFLKVFKDSTTDGTYSDVLHQHTPEEQARIEAFVKGKSLEEVGHDFVIGPSLGCRQELQRLDEADEIAHVSAAGITPLKVVDGATCDSSVGAIRFEEVKQNFSEDFHATVNSLFSGFDKQETVSFQSSVAPQSSITLQSSDSLLVRVMLIL